MSKTVVVASAASNKAKKVETSATTWGEFKREISDFLTGDLEAIVRPGNYTLSSDDSVLPEGNFSLFLVPSKNKSGNMTKDQAKSLGKEISEAIVAAAEKAQNRSVEELKDALLYEIENFFDVDLNEVADCPECEEALSEAKNLASRR